MCIIHMIVSSHKDACEILAEIRVLAEAVDTHVRIQCSVDVGDRISNAKVPHGKHIFVSLSCKLQFELRENEETIGGQF